MTHDDNAEDDGLKALRSVWLSMPDEDPPDRGFAELMAAARVKAEEMAKPTLWQRIAATLRRPPVLALATVMVVLGGAALIGRHKDKVAVEQTVSPVTAPATVQGSAAAAQGSAAEDQAPAPAPAPAKEQAEATANTVAATPPPPPPREPVKHHTGATRAAQTLSAMPDDSSAGKDLGADKTSAKLDSTGQNAGDFAGSQAELAKGAVVPRVDPQAPITESAGDLHKKAREAAARGDCAAAIRAIRKIAIVDAGYYQTKVANDPALASCKKS